MTRVTSREIVKDAFDFKPARAVPVYDLFQEGAPGGMDNLNDICLINETRNENYEKKGKFIMLPVKDPFQGLASLSGIADVCERIGRERDAVRLDMRKSCSKTLKYMEGALKRNKRVDGIWLWADIAHKKGLFFSEDFYITSLLPLHKEICSFARSRNLQVVLHSDGNLNSIMPYLIEAGFRGIHPVEASAGMDLKELKEKYRKRMVFLGNFKLDLLRGDRPEEDILNFKKNLSLASSDGGYIFGFESPVGGDIDAARYREMLAIVRGSA